MEESRSPVATMAWLIVVALGGFTVAGCSNSKKVDLKSAPVDGPSAAELVPIFKMGSSSTDLQRDAKEKEIKGKIVQWAGLKVYEVGARGTGCYNIQTSDSAAAVGTFINTCPDDDATKAMIAALKTGDLIDVKGKIDDVTILRSIDLDPATVSLHAGAPAPGSPATTASGAASAPTAGASAPSGAPVFTISKLKPTLNDPFGKKGKYVKVEFSATAAAKPDKGMQLVVKFSCRVGSEMVVDKGTVMDSFDDMNAGETKKAHAMGWGPSQPLDAAPTSCTLSFGSGQLLEDPVMNLGDFCFTPPSAITPGVCQQ